MERDTKGNHPVRVWNRTNLVNGCVILLLFVLLCALTIAAYQPQ